MRTVILPIESSRGSGRSLLRGIVNYSRIHGPWSFRWEPAGLDEILPRLRDIKADGIIMRDSKGIDEILALGIPMIVVRHSQREIPGHINIISDAEAIGNMAAEHLAERGFKHFAYCGVAGLNWSVRRCEVFQQRIRQAGYTAETFGEDRFGSWNQEQQALADWIRELPKPVGMMCCNDDRGHQAAQICKSLDIHIPNDVAIIGVDNDDLVCELSDPPLSSVSVNFERAGFEGAALLDRLMSGTHVEKNNIVVHATHVIARHSTDVTAIEDPYVVKALQYIRERPMKPISVSDVVSSVPLNRRALERRFRNTLNRSILDEIRRHRVNGIVQMLTETNYSVLQIALSLGFHGTEHISRYFRKEKGMSLLQYRKQYGKK